MPRRRNLAQQYLDVAGVIFLAIDADQRVSLVNKKACEVLGYAKEAIVGKNWFDSFVPQEQRSEARVAFERLVAGELKLLEYFDTPVLTASGEMRIISWHSTVLRDEANRIIGTLSSGNDVTERKRAEDTLRKVREELEIRVENRTRELARANEALRLQIAQRERVEEALRKSEGEMRLMFESVTDGIVVTDLDGKIVNVNGAAVQMHGYSSREEMIGRAAVDLIPEKNRDYALEVLQRTLNEGHLTNLEYTLLTNDAREFDAELSCALLRDPAGAPTGFIAITRDITERKRSEEKLQELYKQERELREQVEREMKRRVEFTRELAHELKTPLTSVLAASDLLLTKLQEEKLLGLARNINRSAANLNKRVDELLDLARGEVGMLTLKLEPVDLRQLVREVADTIAPVATGHGQSLAVDLPASLPLVRADADRVQQVLINLLDNAVKFTPRGGKITVRARTENGLAVVEVQDTGRGMSKYEQERLFERYHRPGGGRWRTNGLGLGLALCKTLVQLHGGEIWARSRVGGGSTFGFSLPLEAPVQTAGESDNAAKLWRILIIEDDQEIVDFVRLATQMDWPEVELVSTRLGEEGIDLVERLSPDILILDLGLPDMDGFEVLQEIRRFSSVPVVVLTVRAEESDIIRGLELGADDYIAKPFKQMELLARLKVQLRKHIPTGEETPIVCGPLRFNPTTSQFTFGKKEISLTVVEGRIIEQLMRNAGHAVTHSRLAEALWVEDYPGAVETIRVYIRRLREKLEEDPSNPKLILTRPGIGYSLAKPA